MNTSCCDYGPRCREEGHGSRADLSAVCEGPHLGSFDGLSCGVQALRLQAQAMKGAFRGEDLGLTSSIVSGAHVYSAQNEVGEEDGGVSENRKK